MPGLGGQEILLLAILGLPLLVGVVVAVMYSTGMLGSKKQRDE